MDYLDPDAGQGAVNHIKYKEVTVVEEGAGVYTGDVEVPAGAWLLDVIVQNVALWDAATSAAAIVGDVGDPNGFYDAVDLKATDLTAGQTIRFADQGGVAGAYLISTHQLGLYSASSRTITIEVTSVGAGTAGRTRMLVLYAENDSEFSEVAGFVAA